MSVTGPTRLPPPLPPPPRDCKRICQKVPYKGKKLETKIPVYHDGKDPVISQDTRFNLDEKQKEVSTNRSSKDVDDLVNDKQVHEIWKVFRRR